MSNTESPERFAVRVAAARVAVKAATMLDRPSPEWILTLIAEGERREREGATSAS